MDASPSPGAARPRWRSWDPATGRSAAAGQMAIARTGHLATLLADGRILLVGGTSATDPNRDLASAEIYDPATGMSVPTGSMRFPRTSCHCGVSFIRLIEPAAIRMADGRVMVVGGRQMTAGGVTDRDSTAEIWSPITGSFDEVAVSCDPGRGARAALPDGRVLVTCFVGGGLPSGGPVTRDTNRAQLYDPTTGRFAETGAPTTTDAGSLTVLPDGRVLLAGDALRVSDSRAEIYDPSSGTFTPLPGSPGTPSEILVLADGRSLFAGVDDIRWIFDPADLLIPAPGRHRRLPDGCGGRAGGPPRRPRPPGRDFGAAGDGRRASARTDTVMFRRSTAPTVLTTVTPALVTACDGARTDRDTRALR